MVSYKCAASILFTISHSTAARGASGPSSLRGSEDSSRGLDDSIPVQVGDGEKHAVPSDKTGTLSSGLKAVLFPSPEQIGQDSCIGEEACENFGEYDGVSNGDIGADSCTGPRACVYTGSDVWGFSGVGDHSCKGEEACNGSWSSSIEDNSCLGNYACKFGVYHNAGTGAIGSNSCHGRASCENVRGSVGDNSCQGDNACKDHIGDIPNNCPRMVSGQCEGGKGGDSSEGVVATGKLSQLAMEG